MASRNPYKGHPGAAQGFIHQLGFTDRNPHGKQAERIAWNLERQLERGQPLDYAAARGHAVTPEHPGRKLPNKIQYASGRRSKYTATREQLRPIAGGVRIARPAIQRPLVHNFRGVTPEPRAIRLAGGRTSRTVTQPRQALVMIHRAADTGARVRIDVYDCTHDVWIAFFVNAGEWHHRQHWEGISASELLKRWKESGLTFEEYLIQLARSGKYGKAGMKLSHICLYRVFVTPVIHLPEAPAISPYRRRR